MRKKIEMVAIADLKINLFVRQALDADHVMYLAELIENGVKLPPIKVSEDLSVVDGRHRIDAHELNNRKEIEVEYVDVTTETELIVAGYKANVGGPLPPTQQDTEHTVMLLLDRGESKKRVGELLGLPPGMARRYINEVMSKATRSKLLKAAAAVTDGGMTVAKAAAEHDVDVEKLKQTLTGTRRKQKQGIGEIQRELTRRYRSVSSRNAALFRTLMEKHEDGDLKGSQVTEILDHLGRLQDRGTKLLSDMRKRFAAVNGGNKLKKSA